MTLETLIAAPEAPASALKACVSLWVALGVPGSPLEGLRYPCAAFAGPTALAASALPLLDCVALKPLWDALVVAPLPLGSWDQIIPSNNTTPHCRKFLRKFLANPP